MRTLPRVERPELVDGTLANRRFVLRVSNWCRLRVGSRESPAPSQIAQKSKNNSADCCRVEAGVQALRVIRANDAMLSGGDLITT